MQMSFSLDRLSAATPKSGLGPSVLAEGLLALFCLTETGARTLVRRSDPGGVRGPRGADEAAIRKSADCFCVNEKKPRGSHQSADSALFIIRPS